VSGAIYLACAMTQFVRRLRERWPIVHRVSGRIAISAGEISELTAVAITILFPFHGPAAVYFVSPFAILFTAALIIAFDRVRRGDYARHREWMIRTFAIGTGIATMRLIFVPWLLMG
jgi:uncharacterized membrane protein